MHASEFPDTRWTLIVAAAERDNPAADEALAQLCRAYWYPLYAFVRRAGHSVEDAQDLTQEFFTYFLERRRVALADGAKGRFRSFLLTSFKRFVADQTDKREARKRGGGIPTVPLDVQAAEEKLALAMGHDPTAERLFEREWALTLIGRVSNELRAAFAREGRAEQFDRLKHFLPGHDESAPYADVAHDLGANAGAVKVAVHRLRRRYRDLFYAEIAHLVADPAEIEGEVRYILNALRR